MSRYDIENPNRIGRIEAILSYYRHLWSYAEREHPEGFGTEPCAIDIDLVEFRPDSEIAVPLEDDELVEALINHGYQMMGVLKQHNIITEMPSRDQESGYFAFILNEPRDWTF